MALAADCINRDTLRALAVQTLIAANTNAGSRVHDPKDWPDEASELAGAPTLMVITPTERKESLARGVPQFDTTITLVVLVRVSADTDAASQVALDRLCDQVERAILCTPAMIAPIQQFVFVETSQVITVMGSAPVGEATVMFGCEVYQIYEPDAGAPLTGLDMTVPPFGGQGAPVRIRANLPQPP